MSKNTATLTEIGEALDKAAIANMKRGAAPDAQGAIRSAAEELDGVRPQRLRRQRAFDFLNGASKTSTSETRRHLLVAMNLIRATLEGSE